MISDRDLWTLQSSYEKIIVAALVSAGKSTLINALLGKDLFPMASSSCTAKITGLLVTGGQEASQAKWHFDDGTYGSAKKVNKDLFTRFNADSRNGELFFKGSLYGIKNNVSPCLIVDTPGINDASVSFRSEITVNFLQKIKKALIIYVGCVNHVGIYDEERFFQMLRELSEQYQRFEWIIVLNRADTLNRSCENIHDFMDVEYALAQKCGLSKPRIFPLSALGALLCRRILKQEEITEDEFDEFDRIMRYYGKDIPKETGESLPDIELYGKKYCSRQIARVCSHTGISELEEAILNYIRENK